MKELRHAAKSSHTNSQTFKGEFVWRLTVIVSLVWSTIVTFHFLFNDFQSEICGAGFLEIPQILFVVFCWVSANFISFGLYVDKAPSKRPIVATESATLAFAVFAFWAQSQWHPGCSAYQ